MSENPLISIIIPVYNPGEHLKKCMNSILNQTYKNLEIILIDDGSNDGSELICDKFVTMDSRVKCIHQQNKGVSAARNAGIKMSSGDYYHFLDSDDYMELDAYEHMINIIRENKCDAVTFEYYITFSDHEIINCLDESKYGLFFGADIQQNLMTGMQFCSTKLLSKQLIEGLSFREDIYRGEDTLFAAYALSRASQGVYFDSSPFYHYVQSEDSACRGQFRESQLSIVKLYDAYKELYWEKYPQVKPYFLVFMHEVIISLYYDLWVDDKVKFRKKGLELLFKKICEYQKQVCASGCISRKQKIKFKMFRAFPSVFCLIHKKIHRL